MGNRSNVTDRSVQPGLKAVRTGDTEEYELEGLNVEAMSH